MENVLKIGDKAPSFSLQDNHGNEFDLKDFTGKKNVVLIFYPGDMTPGCTIQLCSIRDNWPKFEATETIVVGINHADAESHNSFAEKHNFPFPLLIDKNKIISKKYGAIKKLFSATVIKRTVVGIDKQGKIVFYRNGMPKDNEIIKSFQKSNK